MPNFIKTLEDLASNTNVEGTVRRSSLKINKEPFEFNEEQLYQKEITEAPSEDPLSKAETPPNSPLKMVNYNSEDSSPAKKVIMRVHNMQINSKDQSSSNGFSSDERPKPTKRCKSSLQYGSRKIPVVSKDCIKFCSKK